MLRPHVGPQKTVFRYHLGLIVPEPALANITVGGVTYSWREGEGVVFDDTFEHSARNLGTSPVR